MNFRFLALLTSAIVVVGGVALLVARPAIIPEGRLCTMMACSDHVTVYWKQLPANSRSVRMCVDDFCRTAQVDDLDREGGHGITIQTGYESNQRVVLRVGQVRAVTLELYDAHHRQILRRAMATRVKSIYPNGKLCGAGCKGIVLLLRNRQLRPFTPYLNASS